MQSSLEGHSLFEVHCGAACVGLSQYPTVPASAWVVLHTSMRTSMSAHCVFVAQV